MLSSHLIRELKYQTETCIYVGKGPTAMKAKDHLSMGDVAAMNDASKLFPGSVDWGFFYDYEQLLNAKGCWERIRTFLVPPRLHFNGGAKQTRELHEVEGLPLSRVSVFKPVLCCQNVEKAKSVIRRSISSDEVAVDTTALAGIHCLCLLGYKHICLFGHDGGLGYAPGVCSHKPNMDHTRKRLFIEELIPVFSTVFGTAVEFFN